MATTPTLITEFLPSWLADFVKENANELQVPENAVALLGIGAVYAAVNGGAESYPTSTWHEPVAGYVLALLASGEGKSPVFSRLFDVVRDASDTMIGSKSLSPKAQAVRNRTIKRLLRKYETRQINLADAGKITLQEVYTNIALEERRLMQASESGVVPVRILTDTTPAALLEAMEGNDGRVVVAAPEAEAILGFRGGSMNAILQGFDGEVLTVTRKTTGEITVERPIVNMTVAMQPGVLEALGQNMVNRGVMPRFLMAYPETLVGRRHSRPTLVSMEATEAYDENIVAIVERFGKSGEPVQLRWDRAATKEIGTWRDEIEPMLVPGGSLASIDAWASKVRGAHFIRMAALLAIMDDVPTVGIGHAKRAKNILRILMDDARRAFGQMGASFAEDDLVHLMGIVGKLTGTFAKRDIMRSSNRFMKEPLRATDALARAVEEGFLEKDGRGWRAV